MDAAPSSAVRGITLAPAATSSASACQEVDEFPLLDLPCGPLLLVWQHLDPASRKALFQSSKGVRARPGIAAETWFVAHCSAETAFFSRRQQGVGGGGGGGSTLSSVAPQQGVGGLLAGEPPSLHGVGRARMVHDTTRLARTSIERFFKHSASRHLLATCRAALRDLPTRQLLCNTTQVTLQSWDLDDTESPLIPQHLVRLYPRLRHLDLSTCVVGSTLLHTLQRELTALPFRRSHSSSGSLNQPTASQQAPQQQQQGHTRRHGGASGGGAGGASNAQQQQQQQQQQVVQVLLPPNQTPTVVDGWQAACPTLKLLVAPPLPAAKAEQGSPPRWAISPARPRPEGSVAGQGMMLPPSPSVPAVMRTSAGGSAGGAGPSHRLGMAVS